MIPCIRGGLLRMRAPVVGKIIRIRVRNPSEAADVVHIYKGDGTCAIVMARSRRACL
ncbi:hypothetical protein GXY_16668 [Novacetimonas hansenii ATCC 23769]|uniref:Uncharacterized protein n=1 Tax=Novacetimonas hansenii ATCC 23769 TaxID=714995 RepID=D5QJJ9_NOVHA|nr:hypothetical protein GXY_16668 [Novacetimonas hansenii ATCC 23769]